MLTYADVCYIHILSPKYGGHRIVSGIRIGVKEIMKKSSSNKGGFNAETHSFLHVTPPYLGVVGIWD